MIFFGIGRGGKIALDYYSNRFSNEVDTLHFYIDQETVSNERSGENLTFPSIDDCYPKRVFA